MFKLLCEQKKTVIPPGSKINHEISEPASQERGKEKEAIEKEAMKIAKAAAQAAKALAQAAKEAAQTVK